MPLNFPDPFRLVHQHAFRWVPWYINFQRRYLDPTKFICYGWLKLPNTLYLSFGTGADPEERIVCSFGPFILTRLETEEEREAREESLAEALFLEYEANRYTEWYY